MLAELKSGLNALTHGWSGLALGYATVQGLMLRLWSCGPITQEKGSTPDGFEP